MRTPSRGCARRAPSRSARRTCRWPPPTTRATTPSTGRRTTRGTRRARRAARRAARPRPSRRGSRRWSWAATSAAPSAAPRTSAASTATSRASGSSPCAATSRRCRVSCSSPPLGVAGPLARSAADLELALDVLAPAPPGPSRHERLEDFRVALWADGSVLSADARCLDAMRAYADDLRGLGVTVDEDARPDIDVRASDDLYVAMLFATISAGMPEEVPRRHGGRRRGAGPGGLSGADREGGAHDPPRVPRPRGAVSCSSRRRGGDSSSATT